MRKYNEILQILPPLLDGITYDITVLANTSALLYEKIDGINWVGFYLARNNQLELGPFQGKVACNIIPFNKGVCGACATTKKTIMVPNVHAFKGHIACDSASKSEICIPIMLENKFYGLLDIDAPIENFFTQDDQIYLEQIIDIIRKQLISIKC